MTSFFLSEDETQQVTFMAVATAQKIDGRESLPDAELEKILKWADDTRIRQGLLEAVLDSSAWIRWDAATGQPSFSLTATGTERAEQIIASARLGGETPA